MLVGWVNECFGGRGTFQVIGMLLLFHTRAKCPGVALCSFVMTVSWLMFPSTVTAGWWLLYLELMDRILRNLSKSLAFLFADSDAIANSLALSNISSYSASSLHWIFWSSIPHTIRSRSISFSEVPKLQGSNKWQKSVTHVEIDSPPWQFHVLKQYLWMITDGFGSWCFVTRSWNFSSIGFLGDTRFRISL